MIWINKLFLEMPDHHMFLHSLANRFCFCFMRCFHCIFVLLRIFSLLFKMSHRYITKMLLAMWVLYLLYIHRQGMRTFPKIRKDYETSCQKAYFLVLRDFLYFGSDLILIKTKQQNNNRNKIQKTVTTLHLVLL